jgi:NADH-quinone oxidoreductase subunit L
VDGFANMIDTTSILAPLTTLTLASEGGAPAGSSGMLTWAVPALTLLATVLCGLCAAFKVKSKLPAWITVACLAGSFAAIAKTYMDLGETGHAIAHAFDWFNIQATVGAKPVDLVASFSFYIDSLTLAWMLFVTGLATLIALYASEYMSHDVGAGYCRFFAAFNLFVFSMSCLVMGDNLILLYLGWEGVGLCSYLLIGYFYKKPSAVAAAKKAFIVNRIGDLFLALGIFLTFVHFGSVEYKVIFAEAAKYIDMLREGRFAEIPFIVQLIPLLLMVGAFGKSAQLPLYVWLPDAMEGPTPVSALIHAATMVTAGVYLIARTYPLFLCSEYALPTVAWVGSLTALLAATIGMAQFDIKRIMAYSTVSQLGYMFAGLAVLSNVGGVFHVVTHAFFKALLFLCCGAVMHGFGGQLDLRKLSGVAKMKGWLVVSIGMFVGCINLAGVPFTAGFFSKDMILAEAFVTPGMAPIGWILLFTAGLTAYYTFRVFFRVFVGPQHYEMGEESHGDDHGHDHAHGHDHGHGKDHGHAKHDHGQGGHANHPHAPGWAINTVLATLAVLSIAAAGLNFLPGFPGHGGAVATMVQHSSTAFSTPFGHHEADHGHGDPAVNSAAHLWAAPKPFVPAPWAVHSTHGEAPHAGTFLGQDPHGKVAGVGLMYWVSGVVGFVGIAIAFMLHFAGRTTAAKSKADGLLPAFGPLASWAQHKWYVDEFYDFLIKRPILVLSHIFHVIDALLVDGLVNLVGATPRFIGKALRPSQSGRLHEYATGMAGGLAMVLLIVLVVTTLLKHV